MKLEQTFTVHIGPEKQGTYFEIPFTVPENICRIDVAYAYPRRRDHAAGGFTVRTEDNIVDLAVRDGNGEFVGSSGSDRNAIHISAWDAAQGYARVDTLPGEWAIICGAYKIEPDGVDVQYTITFTEKERRLLKGDTHMHTLGSDGSMSVYDTAQTAKKLGLDYIFITDHNNYAHNLNLPDLDGITILPGAEWTHYKGHAGLLGVKRPFGSAFCVNTQQEAEQKLAEARANGALIVLNHPFCPNCGWHFGFDVPFDLIELWNGGTVGGANTDCLRWWHEQLCAGKRIPVIGGSDFHRAEPLRMIGLPCTCVYALSPAPADILAAIRAGHSFLTATAGGPTVDAYAGQASLGDTAPGGTPVTITVENLRTGDTVRLITDRGTEELCCPPSAAAFSGERTFGGARFVRFEVVRAGVPVLLTNPIYFS